MQILFLNSWQKKCGVYQYGLRLFSILIKSNKHEYTYKEVVDYDDYNSIVTTSYNGIFYNYHAGTMEWLNSGNIFKNISNIALQHDLAEYYMFDVIIKIDTSLQKQINQTRQALNEPFRYTIPRPIYVNIPKIETNSSFNDFINYSVEGIPIFGSFGFISPRKGFSRIVELINKQYDNAIIKFLIPFDGWNNSRCIDEATLELNNCYQNNKNPNIKIMICQDFVDHVNVLHFLQSTTLNLFLYENDDYDHGVSSVIDFALSVNTPFAISYSKWFRHIYNDIICVEKYDLNYIIQNSSTYLNNLRLEHSNKKLIEKMDLIIDNHAIIKKRVAILYCGKMIDNANEILNSIKNNLLTVEFNDNYEYDIFVSTNKIDIELYYNIFGRTNIKNVHLLDNNFYLNSIENNINDFEHFKNKYLQIDFKGYENHIDQLYNIYCLYDAYNLMLNYSKVSNNVSYDYILSIKPNHIIKQPLIFLFNILKNTDLKIILEHNFLYICKFEFAEIFKLIEYYGCFQEAIDNKRNLYNFLSQDKTLANESIMMFHSTKQTVDNIYFLCEKYNYNINNTFLGIRYSNFIKEV